MSTKDDSCVFTSKEDQSNSTGTQSLRAAMNHFVKAVNDMDSIVMIPNLLKDIHIESASSGTSNNAVIPFDSHLKNSDLYGFYTMLNAIKAELIRGAQPDEAEDENNPHIDDQSKRVASMFRYHLRGLFNVMNQLTETAKFVTSKYQQELVDPAGLMGGSGVLPYEPSL